ncbi:hypothetical protein BC835DRAFT_1413472 [Cytidiella melzeri]|nr:hypothetical protein BC835DRAFT_1413472 [Cytidiella melzeri]
MAGIFPPAKPFANGLPWMYELPPATAHRDITHGGHIAPFPLPYDEHQLSTEDSIVLRNRGGPTLDAKRARTSQTPEDGTAVDRGASSLDTTPHPPAQQNSSLHLPPANDVDASNGPDRLPPNLQAKLKVKERQVRKDAFDVDLDNLFLQLRRGISEIAEKHNKKESHVESLIFNGGTRYLNNVKTSAWNAWSHFKYQELNADVPVEERIPLGTVQRDYAHEYYSLTGHEKQHYAREYEVYRDERKSAPRPTARGKIQDVVNTTKKIEQLMIGLDNRVGIQGMFCIVRSSTVFAMDPRWFFTSTELEKYLEIAVRKWDTPKIGAQMEAYAVAGGSVTGMLQTSKMKATWLKTRIRDKVSALLVEITGKETVKMNYVSFQEAIVERFHIILEGWPPGIPFVNPSELSDTLPPLQSIDDALTNGACKFVRISEAQVQARRERIAADVASGKMAPRKARKPRKDAGVARGSRKAAASKDTVEEESESEDQEEEGREGRSRKRQRKT